MLTAFEARTRALAAPLGATSIEVGAALLRLTRIAGLAFTAVPAGGALVLALRGHVLRAGVLGDRTGDVGQAFAAAGGGNPLGRVNADDAVLGLALALPGGRAPTFAELEAMDAEERVAWYLAFLRLPEVARDTNFRGVLGILEAARDARSGLFDPPFDTADAAVVHAMVGGWLAANGLTAPSPQPENLAAGYLAAAAGWRAAFDGFDPWDPDGNDERWVRAEERAVRYGEAVVAGRGISWPPERLDFFRFTHVARCSIAGDREGELLVDIVSEADAAGLRRLVDDVGGVIARRVEARFDAVADAIPEPPWWAQGPVPFLLPSAVRLEGAVVGRAVDEVIDRVPVAGAQRIAQAIDALDDMRLPTFVDPSEIEQRVGELLIDVSATPPPWLADLLDEVLEVDPIDPNPTAAYYLALLVDRGYFRDLPNEPATC